MVGGEADPPDMELAVPLGRALAGVAGLKGKAAARAQVSGCQGGWKEREAKVEGKGRKGCEFNEDVQEDEHEGGATCPQ